MYLSIHPCPFPVHKGWPEIHARLQTLKISNWPIWFCPLWERILICVRWKLLNRHGIFINAHHFFILKKSHNASVPYPTMHHSRQKCAQLCSEWCTAGYGTGAFWNLWNHSLFNNLVSSQTVLVQSPSEFDLASYMTMNFKLVIFLCRYIWWPEQWCLCVWRYCAKQL